MTQDGLTLSDEDDFPEEILYQGLPEMHGTLSKWTNYIHGWQDRFVILKQGTLSYYKSEDDVECGCRGAVSISKSVITAHELDELRFDVNVNDSAWYLRTGTARDRNRWMDAIDFYKCTCTSSNDSGYSGSENSLMLKRQPSCLSIASHNSLLSTTQSASSLKRGGYRHCLKEKMAEMETFRDILCQQLDSLQAYFDACAKKTYLTPQATTPPISLVWPKVGSVKVEFSEPPLNEQELECIASDLSLPSNTPGLDFKGQAFSFKATAGGLMNTLAHCIDLLTLREEHWKNKLEKEIEKRKKYEELYKAAQNCNIKNTLTFGGPDFEEGPHCAIKEEEFFDAVESTLDKFDKEEHKLLERQKMVTAQNIALQTVISSIGTNHPHKLYAEIDRVFEEQLKIAQVDVIGGCDWQLIAEEGDMKIYKKEMEEGGLVCDPLKAIHTVNGVTAREVCHYFFDPKYRHDWETTLDSMKILEAIAEDTLVFHQIHKRVWPATQRDSCFWSHIKAVSGPHTPPSAEWAVCNYSTQHEGANVDNCIRVKLAVFLHCLTIVDPKYKVKGVPISSIPRGSVRCQITYCSKINPGGWTPPSVLRAVYKREYPKFLKKFTSYVQNMTKDSDLLI